MQVIELLKLALQNKASDLHLSAGVVPMLRVDGDMQKLDHPILEDKQARELCYSIMAPNQIQKYQVAKELDFSFAIPDLARFRVNIFEQNRGMAAVFRNIPMNILTLDELQAPSIFKEITTYTRGLVLVTGPTGSGKSTTLAAMIDYINSYREVHILTIEDPIEFVYKTKKSLITQREVIRDTQSFSSALRSALREDPDVILIGELRDLESIRLALTAAETGHLVLATLHTSSAAQTIDRLIDVFPGEEKAAVRAMLSESLRAVISQTLIKRPQGGRVAGFEIMIVTAAIRHLIREAKVAQMVSMIQTNRLIGMQTLDQHLQELLKKQWIEKREAREVAENKELFN